MRSLIVVLVGSSIFVQLSVRTTLSRVLRSGQLCECKICSNLRFLAWYSLSITCCNFVAFFLLSFMVVYVIWQCSIAARSYLFLSHKRGNIASWEIYWHDLVFFSRVFLREMFIINFVEKFIWLRKWYERAIWGSGPRVGHHSYCVFNVIRTGISAIVNFS